MRVRPAEKSNSKGPRRAEAKSRNERNGRGGCGALPTAWTLRDVGTEEDSQDGMVGSGVCPVGNSAWCGEDGARPAVQVHSSGTAQDGVGKRPTLGGPEAQLIGLPLGAEVV